MKKQYIDPAMEVIKIETMPMLSTSDLTLSTEEVDGGLSREYDDDWDD